MSQCVSIIIPVWNGVSVITDCLRSVYTHSGDVLLEVICVDNRSYDDSAALIAEGYPQARLLQQPVNLGFAGGINVGVETAQGDIFVLLNQDCIVQPGWLEALLQAFKAYPEFGIAGCTIFESDGTLNHAGAMIRRPEVYGMHLTEIDDDRPYAVEYVTGAAFAIRRQTWDIVGRFDEGYYPGYFEESDYCYRARCKGIETAYVPEAHVTHLFSSRAWKADPIKHNANHHRSRYRFVTKHFDSYEASRFFEAEYVAVREERYFDQAAGRALAARDTLRGLHDIVERRRVDLEEVISPVHRRQLQVGFTQILRQTFSVAENLAPTQPIDVCFTSPGQSESIEIPKSDLRKIADMLYAKSEHGWEPGEWEATERRLRSLRRREKELLKRIYFESHVSSDSLLKRLFRIFVLRPVNCITGRTFLLSAELETVRFERIDLMNKMNHLHHLHHGVLQKMYLLIQKLYERTKKMQRQINRRLNLLEILTDYDYR